MKESTYGYCAAESVYGSSSCSERPVCTSVSGKLGVIVKLCFGSSVKTFNTIQDTAYSTPCNTQRRLVISPTPIPWRDSVTLCFSRLQMDSN
jgi:hypothetical protein